MKWTEHLENLENILLRISEHTDLWQDRTIREIAAAVYDLVKDRAKTDSTSSVAAGAAPPSPQGEGFGIGGASLPARGEGFAARETDWTCESCVHAPPSSGDGKPCCVCDPDDPRFSCYEKREDYAKSLKEEKTGDDRNN